VSQGNAGTDIDKVENRNTNQRESLDMKRKLINFDTFRKIEENSLTRAQRELEQAEEMLARTFGVDGLKLHAYGESDVTYQTADGNYIHATYKVTDNDVILEDIEMLVIDDESQKKSARETLSAMIDSILENQEAKASMLFETYMGTPSVKREMVNEAVAKIGKKKSPLAGKKQSPALVAKRTAARNRKLAMMTPYERQKKLGRAAKKKKGILANMAPKVVKEWARMCENVAGYINYINTGTVLSESATTDERGNITSLRIPTRAKRNEGKILDLGFKTLDSEVKVLRGKMKKISEDQTFVKAMADLKRYNNISDNSALEETLEAIVTRWPDLIYVSEGELAEQIAGALESASVNNYDDSTCAFMAEAILRTAHNAYTDRVGKIAKLAGVTKDITAESRESEDSFRDFADASSNLFAKMDESEGNELRIFSDLYNALHEVHRSALDAGDEVTRVEVAEFLKECTAVLNRTAAIDMDLAEAIADYLADLLEASAEASQPGWDHGVEVSVGGDNPMTKWNAKQAAVASNNTGGWKSAAPVSDGKDYDGGDAEEMGHNALGNVSNSDIYPDLKNPYVPKSVTPKVHDTPNEPEDGIATDQSHTWPNLSNPMAPKPKMPKPVV